MIVKIPRRQTKWSVDRYGCRVKENLSCQYWLNFVDDEWKKRPSPDTIKNVKNRLLADHNAVWNGREHVLEFENDEDAVLFVLRWS